MEQFAHENGIRPKPIDDDVMAALASRKWPGNVRELKNVVERAAILSGDRVTSPTCRRTRTRAPSRRRPTRPATADPSQPLESMDSIEGDGPGEPRAAALRGGQHMTLREFREKTERQYIVDTLQA